MNFNLYADRIEERFDDPAELERIREQARNDASLSDGERERVEERVGMYLADRQRESEPFDEDTAIDEGDEGASS